MNPDFQERYGPWALVVGSVEGMGACYAERFAEQRLNVALLDYQAEPLVEQAAAIEAQHGVSTMTLVCDLSEPSQVVAALDALADVEVGIVVCNAAFSSSGHWHAIDLATKQKMININCVSTTIIIDRLSRPMAGRGRGGIIFVSSMASLQGSARQATYAACKSFDLILGESLWDELGENGVDVLTLIAPMVRTPAFERHAKHMKSTALLPIMAPADVVDEALAALGREASIVAGRNWRVLDFAMRRLMPRQAVIKMIGRQMRSRFPGPS